MPSSKRKVAARGAGEKASFAKGKAIKNGISNKKARKSDSPIIAKQKDLESEQESYGEDDEDAAEGGFVDLEEEGLNDEDSDMEGGFEDLEGEGEQDGEQDDDLEMDGAEPDQEEDEAEKDAENDEAARPSKKPTSRLYAIPTNQEMQTLRSTGELFKNNVLKLQIEELFSEIRPAYEKAGALELVLRRLQSLLNTLPTISSRPLPEALAEVHTLFPSSQARIRVPFAEPSPLKASNASSGGSALKFGVAPPAALHLVGSWPLKSATKRPEGFDIDMAIVMPSALFQEKDHMTLRYAHKRNFYLAVVAAAVQEALVGPQEASKGQGKAPRKSKGGETSSSRPHAIAERLQSLSLSWELLDNDPRRPVLLLTPIHDKGEMDFSKLKARIRIHPAYDPATVPFNFSRLAPSRNGIRINVAANEASSRRKGEEEAKEAGAASLLPTPIYNTTVLLDGLQLAHLVYLHNTACACPAFQDACALLKTWAFQRGFGTGAGKSSKKRKERGAGEDGGDNRQMLIGSQSTRFVLEMMLAHLLKGDAKGKRKLVNGFSSYQLFRGVIDWLAKHDFSAEPVFMRHIDSIPTFHARIPADDFSKHFEKVFVDPTGAVNLFAFMPAGNVDKLQLEARRTITLLDDAQADHFNSIFLSDLSAPALTYDEVVQLSVDGEVPLFSSASAGREGDAKQGAALRQADVGTKAAALSHVMSSNIPTGLRDRAAVVGSFAKASASQGSESLHDSPDSVAFPANFGISYNIATALRIVDHGPAPTDAQAAAAYREFWGEVAELRRFKDGRVLESIVWPAPLSTRRWETPRHVVKHVLKRHHGISADQVLFLGECYDGILDVDVKLAQKAFLASPADKGFQLLQTAMTEFSKVLRMTDLPLSLSSILSTSSALRGMSTFIPGPLNINGLGSRVPDVASYLPVHRVVLNFESSGRWPDDLQAIQAMKAAFFERIAASIVDHLSGARTRVVFDDHASDVSDRCLLEVILPTGFAFQASIVHDRERVLLQRILDDKLSETPARKRTARIALATYERRFDFATKHHTAVNVIGLKFPAFCDSVRLAKRWVSAQMLSSHVPEELIELLMVGVFLSLGDSAPASAQSGFSLFLHQLSSWRWREEPMLVPLFTAAQAPEETKMAAFPASLRSQALEAFQQARSSDPSLSHRAWYIATEQDINGRWWGESHPFAGAAAGLQQLARSAVRILSSEAVFAAVQGKTLFTPPTEHYDFRIFLQPYVLPKYAECVTYNQSSWDDSVNAHAYRNMSVSQQRSSVLGSDAKPNFDTLANFATLLERLYGDSFKLFYDENGGTSIAGLWNPSLSTERPYKVALGFSSQPVRTEEHAKAKAVQLNREAVLAEIQRLGKDLILRTESKS